MREETGMEVSTNLDMKLEEVGDMSRKRTPEGTLRYLMTISRHLRRSWHFKALFRYPGTDILGLRKTLPWN